MADVKDEDIVASFTPLVLTINQIPKAISYRFAMLRGPERVLQIEIGHIFQAMDYLQTFTTNGRHRDPRSDFMREFDPLSVPEDHPLRHYALRRPQVCPEDYDVTDAKVGRDFYWDEYKDGLTLTVSHVDNSSARFVFNQSLVFVLLENIQSAVKQAGLKRPAAEGRKH